MDVFELAQYYSLNEILDFYKAKYPEHSVFRALMSLSYFDDADQQMSPKVFNLPDWDNIKLKIQELTSEIIKNNHSDL